MALAASQAAFDAWNHPPIKHFYDNPDLALFMANHPDLVLPDLEEFKAKLLAEEQAKEAARIKREEEEAAIALAAAEEEQRRIEEERIAQETQAEKERMDAIAAAAHAVVMEANKPRAQPTEEDAGESLADMRKRMQAETKKAPVIPPELLSGNSYEDKVMVMRMIADHDKDRVARVLRNMIRGS
jgi:type IV secretory pathway VirB10-like protein